MLIGTLTALENTLSVYTSSIPGSIARTAPARAQPRRLQAAVSIASGRSTRVSFGSKEPSGHGPPLGPRDRAGRLEAGRVAQGPRVTVPFRRPGRRSIL